MTTESLSVTIDGELLTVEIGTVAAPAGGGGSGDVVGPASATDDRIAAFDGVTGKLIKQGSVTATAVASHLGSTSNPHSVTAAQVGADATGTAAAAVVAHAGATDPHGDRAFTTSAVSTHSALTTGVHGITAAGAALLDDATAADQRTTLGLGTAATTAATAYEASGAIATHNAVTTAHGISAYGATLVDDADAATARTTLGLGTAATSASGDFATVGHNHSGVYQPSDAELTAIAGLTSAADSAPYFTGSGTAALMTVTAAGRAILDDADASAQRTTLGLAIGTNVQAYDADLTTWAGITPGTGVGTALAVNVGTAGSVVTNGGALGTPSSGNLANCTGYPGGSGDVVGPASSTDNAIARFDGTTGELLQNTSNVTIADTGALSITPDANAKALTIASHTHTTSNPAIDVSQTWNAAGVAFNLLRLAMTDTASAAGSTFIEFTKGGNTTFKVDKNGGVYIGNLSSIDNTNTFVTNGQGYIKFGPWNGDVTIGNSSSRSTHTFFVDNNTAAVVAKTTAFFGWSSTSDVTATSDARLYRDAADTLALRRTTNAQTLRVYGTYTDTSNYVRASLAATSTAVTLAAETAGTGADNVPVILTPAGTSQVEVGNGVQFTEMTAPSAPAANKVILFAQDNGAGKTQLMALFPSGASQQVAIEP